MSYSTNYNSIINKSLNKPRIKPSAYLQKLKERKKNNVDLNNIIRSPATINQILNKNAQTDQQSSGSSSPSSIRDKKINSNSKSTSQKRTGKSSVSWQSTLNQKKFACYSSLTFKMMNLANAFYFQKQPELDSFLQLPFECENQYSLSQPKGTPILLFIFHCFQIINVIRIYFSTNQKINIVPSLLLIPFCSISLTVLFWKLKHDKDFIFDKSYLKSVIKTLYCFNHSFFLFKGVFFNEITRLRIFTIHIGFVIINVIFDSSFDFALCFQLSKFFSTMLIILVKKNYKIIRNTFLFETIYDMIFMIIIEYLRKWARKDIWRVYYFFHSNYEIMVHKIMRNLPLQNLVLSENQDILLYNNDGKEFCQKTTNI